jgi:hypothetical protein
MHTAFATITCTPGIETPASQFAHAIMHMHRGAYGIAKVNNCYQESDKLFHMVKLPPGKAKMNDSDHRETRRRIGLILEYF